MTVQILIECFGYLGSILVVISMLLTSVKKLRIVNMTGSTIFAIYALIIHSYPTALMNFALVAINFYRIFQLSKKEKHFRVVEGTGHDPVIRDLLQYYREDLLKHFPDLEIEGGVDCSVSYLVLVDTTPAGFLIGNRVEAGTVDILADYATPVYQDCSVGEYLYKELPKHGVKRLTLRVSTVDHEPYMLKMGFAKTGEGYEKVL